MIGGNAGLRIQRGDISHIHPGPGHQADASGCLVIQLRQNPAALWRTCLAAGGQDCGEPQVNCLLQSRFQIPGHVKGTVQGHFHIARGFHKLG